MDGLDKCRDGLKWDDGGFDLKPRWAREPQLDAVTQLCRRVLGLARDDHCHVTFHAEGAFNKLYLVDGPRGKCLLRVSLPVDPAHKTRGESTTLRWIRRMTLVPVPKVIAFDDSRDNEIGFEWILMELMPGVSAYARWRKMSMADKTRLVEQIVDFQSQLFRRSIEDAKFQSIGTLFSENRPADIAAEPAVFDPKPGRLVSRFFWGDHFQYDVPRGPFPSSYDWLSTYLGIICQEQTDILQNDDDEDVREDAESSLQVATKLTALLPKIFPPLQHPAERTVLWHDDLSLSNILVDADGTDDAKVTAILDWECVSCQPLWAATEMPEFLLGPTREAEPVRDGYADDDGDEDVGVRADDGLDNEGKTELYWIHRMEYDMTRLRKVYKERMEQLVPWWEMEVRYGALKLDFLGAVARCAAGWHLKGV
ncbi:phosphotransferase enzyme family-domain-containing protein [Chaetomium tenue]|uniref:Phosphotransferase enzyme family-domain-containing protein n=1 Tax=Chaetomium tenue TaxID=1854479 RepID=A0ACB7P445_9PEZI|nr:phosphotransferase enzyme family-domain-containing protein [Chaetomium globosum]